MILTKLYLPTLLALIIIFIIASIFGWQQEWCNKWSYKGTEKYKKGINTIADIMYVIVFIAMIIFVILNIVFIIYGIIKNTTCFIIIGGLFIIFMIGCLIIDQNNLIASWICALVLFIYLCYIFILFVVCVNIHTQDLGTVVRKVNTIDIIELQKVPYTNVSGTRFYIRSEPSLAYYYDIVTDNGGTTTEVIDGNNNYVERFEDDIYKENPHIDVFEVVEKKIFTDIYFRETEYENLIRCEYYIYIPKNGIYFDDKE